MEISLFFAWYDFWIGWFFDRQKRVLYICPLPMCVIKIKRKPKLITESFDEMREKFGHYFDNIDPSELR